MRNEKREWEFRNPAGNVPLPGSLAGRSAVKWVSGVQNFHSGLTRKRPDAKMLGNGRKSPKTGRKRWSSWIRTVENPIFIQTGNLRRQPLSTGLDWFRRIETAPNNTIS